MVNQIWLERIQLADLKLQRESFNKKISDLRISQQTCSHLIISVITCGIFAIIKAAYLWILEIGANHINKKIDKIVAAQGLLGDAVVHITPNRMQIEVKHPLEKMKEMNKGLIQALQEIAEASPKQDDIAILFDQITEILGDVKRGLSNKPAMSKEDAKEQLKKAADFLDKALAKAKEHFEDHKKFNVFEVFCLELRSKLLCDITLNFSIGKNAE
jgi:hypothetical protein